MISRSAVIGAGVMGTGIAQHLATAGCDVVLIDTDTTQLDRARDTITDSSIIYSNDLTDCRTTDFVIEAVSEDLTLKRQLFRTLSQLLSHDTIIASNTSSLLIRDLADAVSNHERFLGIHYNNPANFNPIVEIIPTAATEVTLTERLERWYQASGKQTVICQDTSGFVLNRQSLPYINEAARCLDVAAPECIDAIARSELGVELGPFAVMNLVGLKVMATASKNLEILGDGYLAADALQQKAASNEATWQLDQAAPLPSNLVTATVRDRLLGAMLFPGQDILRQGLCSRDDLHLICRQALGYERSSPELLEQLPGDEIDRLIASYRSGGTG